MTEQVGHELARSRRELGAVKMLIDGGYPEVGVSRAYYGVFHAAVAALLTLGEARSKHSGVISTFRHLVVHKGGFDREVALVLRDLFEERNDVDCGLDDLTAEQARVRLARAARFVDAVERWIESRP